MTVDVYDIVIAGGGPVGSALALGLRDSGFSVGVLEARRHDERVDDARTLALSHGSRLILERVGVWDALADVTPIREIVVSQQRGFGRVELNAAEAGVPALGYVVGYAQLYRALSGAVDRTVAQVMPGCMVQAVHGAADFAAIEVAADGAARTLRARLFAIADGDVHADLVHVKSHDYRQSAVVCRVVSEAAHGNRAFERFTPDGPLALLPIKDGWSLVWTAPHARAQKLAALADLEFCARLKKTFGAALGAFTAATKRQVFPLALKYATRPVAPRVVLVGNAAQTLHPVAGQGFNLGLRDAWELSRVVSADIAVDPGSSALLDRYCQRRRIDRIGTITFTDTLIRLFSNDIPLLRGARAAGLAALGVIAPAKRFVVRRMMFGARG